MEKPERVEVGQRWKCGDSTITVKNSLWAPCERCVFLGGPSPSPTGGERTVMAEDRDGCPIRCLHCGGDKGYKLYVCEPCMERIPLWADAMWAWLDDGARDFPRPTPAPTGAPARQQVSANGAGSPSIAGRERTPVNDSAPAAGRKKPASSYRGIGETRALDGTPLSCLGGVPCLRSSEQQPVEPWVPSDLDGDIPDAFPRRR